MATPPPPAPGNPYAKQPQGAPQAAPQAPYGYPQQVPQQGAPQAPYGYPQQAPPQAPQQPYGQAPYGQAPPAQAPYGQAPYGQAPYAQPGPGYGHPQQQAPVGAPYGQAFNPNGPVCRFCGGFPAANVKFHGHRGMLILMQFLNTPGPFCRTCGTAVMRDMSAKTMVRGWWGYGSWIFSSIALIRNSIAYNKVKVLPPAMPAPGARQLDPGAELMKRPEAFGLLIPAGLVLFFLVCLVVIAAGN